MLNTATPPCRSTARTRGASPTPKTGLALDCGVGDAESVVGWMAPGASRTVVHAIAATARLGRTDNPVRQ